MNKYVMVNNTLYRTEAFQMATKSILKSIVIKDSKSYRLLNSALLHAADVTPVEVTFSKTIKQVSRSDVRKVLGDLSKDGRTV